MQQRNMLVVLFLVALVVSGCASAQVAETAPPPTFAAATAPIEPTADMEPTATLIPTPLNGSVEGVLVDGVTSSPAANAGIILCEIAADDEDKCKINSSLSSLAAATDEEGKFLFPDIPSGAYMPLYSLSGEPDAGWQALNGRELDLSEQNWRCLLDVYQKLGIYPECNDFQMFNIGAEAMFMPPGAQLEPVTAENGDMLTVATAASFISKQYGVQLDFYKGEPLLVVVEPGQTASVEIKVWKPE